MQVKNSAHTEPIKKAVPVEVKIFPNPTSGEMIPPKANPEAPSKADATPALARTQFIANVFDAVKVRPNIKSKTTNNDSYIQKSQSRQSAIKSTVETTVIPMLPRNTAISGCEKCTVIAEANTMDTALMAKTQTEHHGRKSIMLLHDKRG